MSKETSKAEGNSIVFDSKEIKSLNENNSILTGNNNNMTKSIKDELLYFKNDILKDMKESLSKFHNKYVKKLNDFEEKLYNTQSKSEVCYQKLSTITQGISEHKLNQERFAELERFQVRASESILNSEIKIRNFENELHEITSKYDKIILDSILYPGIIGNKNEFKTFHDLIDFLLINVKKLITAKDKEVIEKKEQKDRMEETLEKFRGHIRMCINKVEEINQDIIMYKGAKLIKNVEDLKNNAKESKKAESTIFQKLEENEKILENINQELINKLKEKTQNINKALTKEILDINNNMKMIQDKYNDYINDFEALKKEVDKNKIILYDLINNLFGGNFKGDGPLFGDGIKGIINSKMKFKSESLVKLYINGLLKFSDFIPSHVNNNQENNKKNILSDVEMDLTKDKKGYLHLNIKNKNNLDYLQSDENNSRNNSPDIHAIRARLKRKLENNKQIIKNKFLEYSKAPKIKQYNNLNILKENEEKIRQRMMESNSLINSLNEQDILNDNSNIIHSKDFHKNAKENISKNNRLFLKRTKQEENKNEEKAVLFKPEEMKTSISKINNNQLNLTTIKKNENDINTNILRKKQLLSAKVRDKNTFNIIERKENIISRQRYANKNNNSTKMDNNKRLYSSKMVKDNLYCNQMDINFDNTRMIQKRDNQKFAKSISQIKNILPYKDRNYFQERVKKFVQFSDKRPNKKSKSAYLVNS